MKGIVLAGPTGVGKTDLSLKLAKLIGADIISCDSASSLSGNEYRHCQNKRRGNGGNQALYA